MTKIYQSKSSFSWKDEFKASQKFGATQLYFIKFISHLGFFSSIAV